MNDVQSLWKNRKWPIRNGLYYADNTVMLLDVHMPWETQLKNVSVNIIRNESLAEIQEVQEQKFTHLGALCLRAYSELNLKVFVGEGAHGSEGFISLTNVNDNNLIWLAYFDCSNPFEEVSLENGVLVAISNLWHVWRFPIKQPDQLSVSLSSS